MLRFGTDGVRGVALREITPVAVQHFARAAARALAFPGVVVGHDPRESSDELARAVAEGFRAEGLDVVYAGMLPTPAVAFLAATTGRAGAVITASHNPYTDNGLKFFRPGGTKLTGADEAAIQSLYEGFVADRVPLVPPAGNIDSGGGGDYVGHLASMATDVVPGLRVVVDCANGAMSRVAPELLSRIGVEAVVFNASPDGTNINVACGAAHPEALAALVRANRCDLGIAFDGDGDRLIAAAADGTIVDGDHLIAMAALDMKSRGALVGNSVVVTVMSNIGFHRAMESAGINVLTTPVGDRSVLVELERSGAVLGGEQSGHIIHRDVATTGDGLLAAIRLLGIVSRTKRSIADLATSAMKSFPQVLLNVSVVGDAKDALAAVADTIHEAEVQLADSGRVLVRASGTEPVVRVMVEARDERLARDIAERIAAAVRVSATD